MFRILQTLPLCKYNFSNDIIGGNLIRKNVSCNKEKARKYGEKFARNSE